ARTLGTTTPPAVQTWTSSGRGAAQYDVWLSPDGAQYVEYTLANPASSSALFTLERNHNYQFRARAKDSAGTWGDWAYGTAFNLGEFQEDYLGDPIYSGTWTRSAWSPASDGNETVSATAG